MFDPLLEKENLTSCYQCGKCSSGCAINRLDQSFRPHRILYLIRKGSLDTLAKSNALWQCTTCFTCSERCPQKIDVAAILWTARTVIAALVPPPESLVIQKDILIKTGRLIPLDNKKREKAGLAALPEESSVVARIIELA